MEEMGKRGRWVHLELRGRGEWQVLLVQLGRRACMETQVCEELYIGEPGLQGPPAGGAVYTRWGRTTCPTVQETHLLYSGRAGATHHLHKGGAANYLCLPNDPDHLQYIPEWNTRKRPYWWSRVFLCRISTTLFSQPSQCSLCCVLCGHQKYAS